MAVYDSVFPDGTPYPVIPAGTNTVNVSSSDGLSDALSSASPGDRILIADGSYSGDFSMSGKQGNATAGISVVAATVGGAVFTSGTTWRITDCAFVTVSGILLDFDTEGEIFQFRGSSHHCRLTRSTFGPSSRSESSNSLTWIYVGDLCHDIRIDHNEIRHKGTSGNGIRVYGSFDKVDSGEGSDAGCRRVRIDHNYLHDIGPEVGNDKEPIRYGVSSMSRTISSGVIERNVIEACECEPEVISVKMGGIRATGNVLLRCAGSAVIRHGTNTVMADNYIVDRANTTASAGLESGGFRFYDADHQISYNYIDGVIGEDYEDPLLLDTGDAEDEGDSLSNHWRVVGARVERNVLVDVPRGISIGDNYSSVPRDCTIRDNLVVDADSGAAITQRVAPSNTVITGNTYYATTTAAGMTQDVDTIWRKPGYGPRLAYLTAADVGPGGDLDDSDGTGVEVGGAVATPDDVLNIGTEAGQNHFQLQYAVDGSTGNDWTKAELAEVAAGLDLDPYFTVVTNTIDDVQVPAVQFQVRADSATTVGSSFPRSELRETRADGSEMAFDAMAGNHTLHTRARITHLPAADPEVVVAQLHDGVSGDGISIRTQLVSGQTKLVCRINGTQAGPRLSESYVVGSEFEVEIRILDGGLVEVFYEGSTTPIATGQLVSTGGATWYWKVGAYAQFDEVSAGSATEYVSVEHRDLRVVHPAPSVDAGADGQVVAGQVFTRTAAEIGITNVISRSWTIVSSPTTPEDPGTPGGDDQTIAAVRYGWGTPLPQSDEFNYTGVPDPSKWKLPGEDWAGHNGNGTRDPERVTVDGEKLIMSGLENGSTGWMEHQLGQQYGRWEARVRSYNIASSGSEYHALLLLWPDSNSRQEDGEYDFMELGAPGQQTLEAFIHYPHPGTEVVQQEHFETPADMSQWHNIAMEWTSDHVKGFIDGEEWFSVSGGANDVRRDIQDMPSGHLCIQLDGFHGDSGYREAALEVMWLRVYSL